MISISSGFWMSNTISHARIISVIKAAEASHQSGVADHSRDMELSERIVDYVFCGGVKERYMNCLQKLAIARIRRDQSIARREQGFRDLMRADTLDNRAHYRIERCQATLASLMSGKTLRFGTQPYGDPTHCDNYLIIRNRRGRITGGIPLHMALPHSGTSQAISTPTFPTDSAIRIRNLNEIRLSGKLICGNKTYTVRFIKDDEPIVMHSDEHENIDTIQKTLRNLWAISQVKLRLSKLEQPAITGGEMYVIDYCSAKTSQEFVNLNWWKKLAFDIQGKFSTAVEMANLRFKAESGVINSELDRLEKLPHPGRDDREAFIKLQTQISLLERTKKKRNANLEFIKNIIRDICQESIGMKSRTMQEPLKVRVMDFCDHIIRFCMSTMDNQQSIDFLKLCNIQKEVFDHHRFNSFDELINPETIRNWGDTTHPPCFHEQHERFFNVVQDPATPWPAIESAKESLKLEKDRLIACRLLQIRTGRRVASNLNGTALNSQTNEPLMLSQGQFSEEYRLRVQTLESIRSNLQSPGNSYTQAELEELDRQFKRVLATLVAELRRNGYVW